MGDYIERQAVLNAYDAVQRKNGPWRFETLIESVPAVDVRPVVRGRWSEKPYLLGTTNVCSVCGENYGMPHGKYNFCPNCGADMKGEIGGEE